ncbi:PREDICTED: uncharacterized protein LOC105363377 [Ceratosolen solmsi marchali]|uniref:Uncharacterized protein LOC105363377 n=1 Tax=Ceratosolen solmsi marchali TaxID=326594 RepID=A0AAJ6YJR6_9HYME|nr:PREDICTED: uncharacterized protein LOC105363377 [Ceratosolen solmsi marchali]
MVDFSTAKFIYFVFLFLVDTVAELDSSKFYIEIGLDNAAICNPLNEKVETVEILKKNKNSAIMVKPSHIFDSWQVMYNKHCKFKIKATKGESLFAVIQRMSLRGNGSECLDYVRFIKENGNESDKYCGELENDNGYKRYITNMNIDYQKRIEYAEKKFEENSEQGKITTEIYISRQPLISGQSLDLIIIYTPYKQNKDCKNLEPKTHFWSSSTSVCINDNFICDGFINCASSICFDESNCTNIENQIVSDGTGTKVTVSAVTTIFLCFIIFIMCLWICRRHKKFCWSPDCAGPSSIISISGLPMEHGEHSISNLPNAPYIPTTSTLEVAVSLPVQDKDLPPSYNSLFPSQSQTNALNS